MENAELFLGRMQPVHLGHIKIIQGMNNPIVVIVRGKKSSENGERNPFSAELQQEMLKEAFPDLFVTISPDGFLPGILRYLRNKGHEVTKIFAGSDRIAKYQKVLQLENDKLPYEQKYKVTFKETDRVTSATEVRDALRNNDLERFKRAMPQKLYSFYGPLRKAMNEAFEVLSFLDWLNEEEACATSVAGDIAGKEEPLKKKIARRKKPVETEIKKEES